jgi:hypothetical protein
VRTIKFIAMIFIYNKYFTACKHFEPKEPATENYSNFALAAHTHNNQSIENAKKSKKTEEFV